MPHTRTALLSVRLALLACTFPFAAHAQSAAKNVSMHFDPAATVIHFTVKSLLHDARGSFKLKGGVLAVDPTSGLAQGEVLIDATTGTTGNQGTDARLQKEVLESGRYPSIFFHAEHLEGHLPESDGAADVTAVGTFNIHGVDHAEQIRMHVVRSGSAFTATGQFTIPYVAWGMKDPSTGMIHYAKQAIVNIDAKGSLKVVDTINETPAKQSSESDEEPAKK